MNTYSNFNHGGYPQEKQISGKKAIELLNSGSSLTQPGKELNTLRKQGDSYSWKGRSDQSETILTEKEVKSLIINKFWVVDLH